MTAYRQNPAVVETDLGEELILLNPATREMFSLNATGRLVWRALGERVEGSGWRDMAAARIAAAFDVDAELAVADVDVLLARLAESGLVEPAPGAGGESGG